MPPKCGSQGPPNMPLILWPAIVPTEENRQSCGQGSLLNRYPTASVLGIQTHSNQMVDNFFRREVPGRMPLCNSVFDPNGESHLQQEVVMRWDEAGLQVPLPFFERVGVAEKPEKKCLSNPLSNSGVVSSYVNLPGMPVRKMPELPLPLDLQTTSNYIPTYLQKRQMQKQGLDGLTHSLTFSY